MTNADELTNTQQNLLKTFHSEFVLITPGEGKFPKSYEMGGEVETETPKHKVSFEYSFYVAKYEVPQIYGKLSWEAILLAGKALAIPSKN